MLVPQLFAHLREKPQDTPLMKGSEGIVTNSIPPRRRIQRRSRTDPNLSGRRSARSLAIARVAGDSPTTRKFWKASSRFQNPAAMKGALQRCGTTRVGRIKAILKDLDDKIAPT